MATIAQVHVPEQERPWRAYVALALGVMCIAWSAIWVKWANMPGPASAFYRLLIAGAVLVPLGLTVRRSTRPARRTVLLAALSGVFFALDVAVWNSSILLTSAANATLLGNDAPLFVGLGAWLLLRERLPRSFWVGMAVALLGILLVLGGDMLRHPRLGLGDALALGAGVFYAGCLLTTQQVRNKLDMRTFMAISTLSSVVVIGLVCLILGVQLTGYSSTSWLAILGLGLITHLGGWTLVNYALGHLRATVVSVSLLGQPVLTALLAIPLFSEHLSLEQIIGGVLVLGGIWWVNRRPRAAALADDPADPAALN